MAKPLNDDLMELAAYSRQLLRADNQPIPCIYDESNEQTNLTLLRLSAELRQAQALERIAEALAQPAPQQGQEWPEVVRIPLHVSGYEMKHFRQFLADWQDDVNTFNDLSAERANPDEDYTFYLLIRDHQVFTVLGEWQIYAEQAHRQAVPGLYKLIEAHDAQQEGGPDNV